MENICMVLKNKFQENKGNGKSIASRKQLISTADALQA